MKAKKNIRIEDVLSIKQYAMHVGLTTQRIGQLIEAGRIATIIVGDRVMIVRGTRIKREGELYL